MYKAKTSDLYNPTIVDNVGNGLDRSAFAISLWQFISNKK